jgi:hypothetical protein
VGEWVHDGAVRARLAAAVIAVLVGAASAGACTGPSTLSAPGRTTTTVARHQLRPPVRRPTHTTTPTIRGPRPTLAPKPKSATKVRSTVPARLEPLAVEAASHEDTYDRDVDFGGWIDGDHDCQNTRAEVLIATSRAPVTFTRASNCTVSTGLWVDPWSGITTTTARAFDIDHTVPLANAWRSGAWAWSEARRVAYANDLADAGHLIAIDASENREKGDDGPEAWRPPDVHSWCRYAITWDRIKARWHLSATTAEWTALVQMAATC